MIGAAAALGGLLIGAISGVWFADRRLRRRIEEVGAEIVRLRGVAEEKLSADDPDLPTLLRNLNTAVEQTYRAVDALEQQAKLTKLKSEGGKEIIASSKHIMRMVEDLGAELPEISKPARTPKLVAQPKSKKKSPPLR